MKLSLAVILALTSTLLLAESEYQTDWSGGPGSSGPVLQWTDLFSSSESIEYAASPGSASLEWGKLTDAGQPIENSTLLFTNTYSEDVDNDGDIDILVTSTLDNMVLWWENQNDAGSWESHLVATNISGAFGAVCADVDNDGDNDILVAAMTADDVIWWENTDGTGTTWDEHVIDDNLDGAKGIAAVDMNQDGQIDIAVAAKAADVIVWYQNMGSGSAWIKHEITSDYDCAMSVFPSDIDQDGDWDILSAAKLDGTVNWFENVDGAGTTWENHAIEEELYYARGANASDIDGDGDIDILTSGGVSKSSGEIAWYENTNGTGTDWEKHVIESDFFGPFSILQYDIDQDGDPDAVSGSLYDNNICWWENINDGSDWERQVVCSYSAPAIISAADLTGDGRIELFAGSLNSFDITWWRTFGYHQEGSLVSTILDTTGDSEWNTLNWTSDTPDETALGISMRSSWDENDLGEWSDTVYTSPVDLSSLIADNDRFVQYSVCMLSETSENTPSLEEIQISWNPLSIEGNEFCLDELLVLQGNPAGSNLAIMCNLSEAQTAQLTLYDLSGRAVFDTGESQMNQGQNQFNIASLSNGVYFAGLNLKNKRITARFTVIN